MTLDKPPADTLVCGSPDARGPVSSSPASCVSYSENREEIKWGGSTLGGRPPKSAPPVVSPPDVVRWYCVRSKFGQEKIADLSMRLDGFHIFNPSIFRKATSARRDTTGAMRPGKPDRVAPLLGRYFFVELNLSEDRWLDINKEMDGVDCLMSSLALRMGTSTVPIAIPEEALAHLRSLLELNDCYYPDGMPRAKRPEIEAGTPLRLTEGPMADWVGVCERSDGLQVTLAMLVMGHLVPVKVAQSLVEVIK